MDTKKVAPGVAAGLSNSAPVSKKQRIGKNAEKSVEKDSVDKGDFNVNLSPEAKSMAEARKKALDIAKSTPDIREDKVADFKRRIESGEYNPSAENIADGMLREAIKDEVAKNPPEM